MKTFNEFLNEKQDPNEIQWLDDEADVKHSMKELKKTYPQGWVWKENLISLFRN